MKDLIWNIYIPSRIKSSSSVDLDVPRVGFNLISRNKDLREKSFLDVELHFSQTYEKASVVFSAPSSDTGRLRRLVDDRSYSPYCFC